MSMPVYHALHALFIGVVQEVFSRHSEMSDPAMANVDQIVLVMSLNLPPFDARQATRFLVSAEAADIPVMLLLNKADLLEDDMTKALVAEVLHAVPKSILPTLLERVLNFYMPTISFPCCMCFCHDEVSHRND